MLRRHTYAAVAFASLVSASCPLGAQNREPLRGLATRICIEGKESRIMDSFTFVGWELPAQYLVLEDKFALAPANDCRDVILSSGSFRMLLTRFIQKASDAGGVPSIYEAYATSLRGELLQAYRFSLLVPPGCHTSACFVRNDSSFNATDETRAQFEQLKALWVAKYGSSN